MKTNYIYLSKKHAMEGTAMVLSVNETRIKNYINILGEDAVEFDATKVELPHYITYDAKNNIIREATLQERYNRGQYIPDENHYVKNGILKEYPSSPENIVKKIFNIDTEQWEETATETEISLKELNDNLRSIQYEIEDTNKFDLISYRSFVTNNGDSIEEIDNYRLGLLSYRSEILSQINSIHEPKSRRKRSISMFVKPTRPDWSKMDIYK